MGEQQRLIAAYRAGKQSFRCGAPMPTMLTVTERAAWQRGWRAAQVIDRAHRIARAYRATAETTGVS